jgi:cytochrome P450
MDSITQFLFGKPMGCLENEPQPNQFIELVNSFEMSMNGAYRRAVLGSLRFLDRGYSAAAERQHFAKTREFVDGMISEAMAKYNENKTLQPECQQEKHKFLFEILVNTTSPTAMRDHIMTTFGAARDTTATLLSQLWFEASRRPEIFSKMKSEVDSVLGGQLPAADTLKKLIYIDHVMKETLRLWPPGPTTMRVANKVCTYIPFHDHLGMS